MLRQSFPLSLTITERNNFREIPDWISKVGERLLQENFSVFLVGGAVRDLLWGEAPADWDLATDALPEQVESVFPKTIPTGKKYGTITVIEDGHGVEITTIREDQAYSDGRRPEAVHFGKDILPDLARRDFTINAMAYDLSSKELIDPFGGRIDVKRRLLRAVGDPGGRFHEDGLRMFRFYRFLATLNLQGHRPTERAINPVWAKGVSYERIRDEFNKLLVGGWVRKGLTGLKRSGLLEHFLPELMDSHTIDQGDYHSWNLWEHLLVATETTHPTLHHRLAALLHDIAKPVTRFKDKTGVHFYGHDKLGAEIGRKILERMRYPGRIISTVANLIRWHMFCINSQTGDAGIRRLIFKVGPQNIPDLLELRRADIIATGKVDYQTWENWQRISERVLAVLREDPPVNQSGLAINGNDLVSYFNLKPGPLIGKTLTYLQEIVLDNPALNERNQLLELAKAYLDLQISN